MFIKETFTDLVRVPQMARAEGHPRWGLVLQQDTCVGSKHHAGKETQILYTYICIIRTLIAADSGFISEFPNVCLEDRVTPGEARVVPCLYAPVRVSARVTPLTHAWVRCSERFPQARAICWQKPI